MADTFAPPDSDTPVDGKRSLNKNHIGVKEKEPIC